VIERLETIGCKVEVGPDWVSCARRGRIQAADITTLAYPGFPTDLQAQFMAILCLADGVSVVTEKIYPERFMHVAELQRMRARVRKEGPCAIVHGTDFLSGAEVMASDLRASAALVLAGLVAEGETEVRRVYHMDRGYERMEKKLERLGARIRRAEDDDAP
jgi:UDP-N-acetylglucosamine 1-carboxyvinyltransferase